MTGPARQLQGVETRGEPIAQRQILAAECLYQALESAVLVEQHLGDTLARQHRDQKSNQHRLTRARRSADEGVTGIAPAIAVGLVAGVQREVVPGMRATRKKGQRISPMVSGRTSGRKIMEG